MDGSLEVGGGRGCCSAYSFEVCHLSEVYVPLVAAGAVGSLGYDAGLVDDEEDLRYILAA